MLSTDKPLTVDEAAGRSGLSRQTIIKMFERERGVLILESPVKGRRRYRTLRIPLPVFNRVIGDKSN